MHFRLFVIHSFLACVLLLSASGLYYAHSLWIDLPSIADPDVLLAKQSLVITDRHNVELFRFYDDEDRTVVSFKEIPDHVTEAFIAIEDKRFFTRSCIDTRALLRALVANIREPKSQGASTITQQLVRTALLTRSKTFERKFKEIMLACKLEWQYDKEEILAMYLNWISFGHGIAGIEQASKRYFGKSVREIGVHEAAVLAALPQRPTYFSPYGPHKYTTVHESMRQKIRSGEAMSINSDDITIGLIGTDTRLNGKRTLLPGRSNIVLNAMLSQGYIDTEVYAKASHDLTRLSFTPLRLPLHAPHFVLTVEQELSQLIASSPLLRKQKGLRVVTSLDASLQQKAEDTVQKTMREMSTEFSAENSALLAVDTKTNEILAYVGNTNFFDDKNAGQIDMVRMPRQTGSAFKPFVYATLLEQGDYTDTSYIHDRPLDPTLYRAHSSGYYGRMTIRTALARSRNVPAIRAFYLAGGEDIILQTAALLGIRTPLYYKRAMARIAPRYQYGWSLALGSAESSLLEMVQGYSVLARDGIHSPITGILAIENHAGQTLFEPFAPSQRRLSTETTRTLRSILEDEHAREPLWQSTMKVPMLAAIKTGTSNLCLERSVYGSCMDILPNNSWTIGFTDDLLIGVWMGNANNTPLKKDSAAIHTSTPLWKSFLLSTDSSDQTFAYVSK